MAREYGGHVVIADSPAWGSIKGNAVNTGLYKLAGEAGIPIRELNHPEKVRGSESGYLYISRQVLEADMIINVPKLKSHVQMKLSGGIKNMFGAVPGKRKAYLHFRDGETLRFANMIIDTYNHIKPAITIIDAGDAMEGMGPISGNLKHIGAIIASTNGFAADMIACKLVDCEPDSVPILQAARQRNILPGKIDILGEDPDNLRTLSFDFPELIPVRFSLIRVAQSIIKQVWKKRSIALSSSSLVKKRGIQTTDQGPGTKDQGRI